MDFQAIVADLKAGKYKPVYFLMGEEPWFIDFITDYITANALSESEKAFNQLVLYGRDTDIGNIINSARRYPMMSSRQVIIVKEAQQLKNLDSLDTYAASPMPSTVLVFAYKYKKVDKRTKVGKVLNEKSVLFESDKVREDKVAAWIISYLKNLGIQIEGKAATLLVDFLGNDLGKIVKELEKLMLVLPAGTKQISSVDIEKNIGISKDFNNFELNRALVEGDILKANRIIRYFADNPKNNPFILTISSLFYYFSKVLLYHGTPDKSPANVSKVLGVHPYFVSEYQKASRNFTLPKTKQIISWLREYDLKSKGGSQASDGDLLKELVFKILH
jgi:DNA polymerase-3 subunit delta